MLLRLAYLHWNYRAVKKFFAATRRSREVQREVLFEKLRRNAQSDFGRDHGMADIRTIEDFRRQIPIANYEYYRPYVERVKKGQIDAMFGPGSKVLMFAMTSGSTNIPKYIPITDHFLREYRRSWNIWGLATYRDHIDLIRRRPSR